MIAELMGRERRIVLSRDEVLVEKRESRKTRHEVVNGLRLIQTLCV